MPSLPDVILVATDFSTRSRRAVDRAARLARQHGAALEIIHVLPGLGSALWWSEPAEHDDRDDPTTAKLHSRLEDLCAYVRDTFGVPVQSTLRRGPVARMIDEHARDVAAGLLVLGATGAGATARRLIGSHTQSITHNATTPVLVVRLGAENDYARMLLATDFSPEAEFAIRSGLALAPQASAHLFCSLDLPKADVDSLFGLDAGTRAANLQKARGDARTRLGQLASELDHECAAVLVRDGRAADELVPLANEIDADLLCLGAHSHSTLEYALMGSTSVHAMTEAQCDVLIIPPRRRRDAAGARSK